MKFSVAITGTLAALAAARPATNNDKRQLDQLLGGLTGGAGGQAGGLAGLLGGLGGGAAGTSFHTAIIKAARS